MASSSIRVMNMRNLTLIRSFSTTRTWLEKAPVQVFGVEGRYAHALFGAASQKNSLDKVENELLKFKDLLKKETQLADYCKDPSISKYEKQDVIVQVMTAKKYSDVVVNFMGLLAENSRLKRIDGIVNAYSLIMRARRGEVDCKVVTAKPLDSATTKTLTETLKKFIKQTQSLKIEYVIDPAIIGGMVINLGDYFIDMSTATKVKRFSRALKALE